MDDRDRRQDNLLLFIPHRLLSSLLYSTAQVMHAIGVLQAAASIYVNLVTRR